MSKLRVWRLVFSVFCLFWLAWILKVGETEFDRVNSQYRVIVGRLDTERVRAAALAELAEECREQAARGTELACSEWLPELIDKRAGIIGQRLLDQKKRAGIKVVMFYAGFVLLFLLAPMLLLYLLGSGLIRLFSGVKIVR